MTSPWSNGRVRAMLGEGGYDAVAAFFMNYLSSPVVGLRMQAALRNAMDGAGAGTLALVGIIADATREEYRRQGILVFEDPGRAVATLGAMAASRRGAACRGTRPDHGGRRAAAHRARKR